MKVPAPSLLPLPHSPLSPTPELQVSHLGPEPKEYNSREGKEREEKKFPCLLLHLLLSQL